jgi:ribonucleoside-diphosphate reductase alpha chain
VRMMAAVQPFISGAISKTVNMPERATVEEVEEIYFESWKSGLKALAIYRDNCKVGQPLSTGKSGSSSSASTAEVAVTDHRPVRKRLPKKRPSETVSFAVAGAEGYMTAGSYPDGGLGEIFVKMSKQGSTLAGVMDAFSMAISIALQYGVPLETYVSKFVNMRFEPAGMTDDPDLRIATSIVDYLFRKLSLMYFDVNERGELNILSTDERIQPTLPGVEESVTETRQGMDMSPDPPAAPPAPRLIDIRATDAPLCMVCGNQMVRAGSCYACTDCGATSGCS